MNVARHQLAMNPSVYIHHCHVILLSLQADIHCVIPQKAVYCSAFETNANCLQCDFHSVISYTAFGHVRTKDQFERSLFPPCGSGVCVVYQNRPTPFPGWMS